jgi:hypothetical protein
MGTVKAVSKKPVAAGLSAMGPLAICPLSLMRQLGFLVRTLRGSCNIVFEVTEHNKERAMKNSHKCPKCQSREIVKIPGASRPAGIGNSVRVGFWAVNGIPVTRYLCGSCGYIEQWIDAAEDIDRIKEYYGLLSGIVSRPKAAA